MIDRLSYRADLPVLVASEESVLDPGNTDDESGPGFVMVAHSGREFLVSESIARIFIRQVRRILRHGASELVVLVHADGVELLPITPITPFSVSTTIHPSEVPGTETGSVATARAGRTPGEQFKPSLLSTAPDPWAMASVPLRLFTSDGTIATLQTTVVHVGDSTYEIQVHGQVIGFIRRTGQVFAAHAGPQVTDSSGWRQWRLWDEAAAFLVRASGFAPVEASDRDDHGDSPMVHDPPMVSSLPGDRIVLSSRLRMH